MPLLPPELIYIIVENIANDRSTLYSLSLTSKQLNADATRLLYANMVDDDAQCHYRFLQTLTMNPALAVLVHVYHSPINDGLQPPGVLWLYVRAGLQLMVNLKELLIRRLYRPPTGIQPIVDDGVQPAFQLERLMCLTPFSKDAPAHLERFVGTQYRLEYLVWMIFDSIPDTLPDTLKCIGGPSTIVRQLLCMKPSIREVSWMSSRSSRFLNADLFKLRAFRHLRFLNIASLFQGKILRYIRDEVLGPFVDLEVLIVRTFHRLDEPEILRSFPKLSELIITSPQVQPGFNIEQQPAIIAALFAQYENIVKVVVCLDYKQNCRRWVKGRLLDGHYILSTTKLLEYE